MSKRSSDDDGPRSRSSPRPPRRGPREGRRELPPEMEALATGESRSLRRKRPRGPKKLSDPRERGLFPGVSNHDARAVYDARVARLQAVAGQAATDAAAATALEDELCTICRVRLWRARNVVGFQAFCADVLGIDPDEAKARATAGAARQGATLQPLPDAHIAAWMRAEAALLHIPAPPAPIHSRGRPDARDSNPRVGPEGRARLTGPDERPRVTLELDLEHSARTLAEIGRREASLLRILEQPSGGQDRAAEPGRSDSPRKGPPRRS